MNEDRSGERKNLAVVRRPIVAAPSFKKKRHNLLAQDITLNHLLMASSKLLTLLSQYKLQTPASEDRDLLKSRVDEEIKIFEKKALIFRYDLECISLAVDILRTFANSCLGSHEKDQTTSEVVSVMDHPLLIHLNRLVQNPHHFIDVLELLYVCLNLELSETSRKEAEWELLLHQIYQLIRIERGELEKQLPAASRPKDVTIYKTRYSFLSILEISAITLLIVMGIYISTFYLSNFYSKHFMRELETINSEFQLSNGKLNSVNP